MLLVEVLQEVVAFLELVDVHTLLVTNRLMCELSILPLATMRISQFDDAVIASYNDSLTLFNLENGIVQSGSITVHKENAGDVLRIVFRNSTIKRLLVRDFNFCKNNDRSSCCVFDEIGGAADTFVITMELGLFDHCFDNTEELVTFVRRFRSINVLSINGNYGVLDVPSLVDFCRIEGIGGLILDHVAQPLTEA